MHIHPFRPLTTRVSVREVLGRHHHHPSVLWPWAVGYLGF